MTALPPSITTNTTGRSEKGTGLTRTAECVKHSLSIFSNQLDQLVPLPMRLTDAWLQIFSCLKITGPPVILGPSKVRDSMMGNDRG